MSALINLLRGKRSESLLKFAGEYKFNGGYTFIEVPLAQASVVEADGSATPVTSAKAGQFVRLRPAGTIAPTSGYTAVVSVNGLLASVGSVSCQSMIDHTDEGMLGASILLAQDFDFTDLTYLLRIYLVD